MRIAFIYNDIYLVGGAEKRIHEIDKRLADKHDVNKKLKSYR